MNRQFQFTEFEIEPTRAVRIRNAHAIADIAIERGSERAERDAAGWLEEALWQVRVFARNQDAAFTVEMMRGVIERTLPANGDKRVWGAITRAALKAGYIRVKKGWFFPAASSHGSPKRVYEPGPKK